MPKVTILVGLPASGKSTWVAANATKAHIYSTDNIVEELAREQGTTYDAIWSDVIKDATKEANRRLQEAIRARKDVVSDRTNLTAKARSKFLAQFPKAYRPHAVLFMPSLNPAELIERLNGRPGKNIPMSVIDRMFEDLEEPTLREGFDTVSYVNTWSK